MNTFDDIDIVRQVMHGKKDQYEILVKKYQNTIYSFMLRFTGSPSSAQELVQETFMKAYSNLKSFDTRKRFFPWMYTIAVNTARDWRRKNNYLQAINESFEETGSLQIDVSHEYALKQRNEQKTVQTIDQKENVAVVQKALNKISHDYREAVLLRYRYDLSFKEIARVFDISLSAAKMRVHRGLRQLKQVICHDND